jgi:2,4-dienoyl-CoA reductase-like NADH-dependent reductase (Old Yellow Enzyme family)/thioredoxin reductase
MMSLQFVYEPLKIKGVEVRNRISRSAHGTNLTDYGRITDQLIDYHVARAKGGVGLTFLEAATVHPSSVLSLANLDDTIIDGYRRLMKAIKPHGMRVFQQIWHGGHIYPVLDQSPPWGVSAVPNPATGIVPNPMGLAEIEEVIQHFANAARRCVEGGIEGIEVHASHGYLIMQFLNPLVNKRTDQYGGSLENRMRFLREVLLAVRAQVPDDYPVGIRMGASTGEGGLGEDELALVVQTLQAEKMIDFLDLSWSDYFNFKFVAAMDQPVGYQLPSSEKIAAASRGIPRFMIGRFRTLDEAEQLLRDGVTDMVHMTRAHIADPDIIRKTQAGKPEQVRSCIGCNQACWQGVNLGYPLACTINPAAGREGDLAEDLIRPADNPGKVVVIGGGPAGMEAARVAALRGHRVTLFEAGPDLGGQVAVAKRAPRLHVIGDIAFWLEQEIFRLGVDVRTSTYAEVEDVLEENPDFVVIACGSIPRHNGIQYAYPAEPVPGFDQPHVLSPIDLLTATPAKLGKSAVVFDDVGHYEAVAAAEFLLSKGLRVTFVTRFASVAPQLDHVTRVDPAFRRFAEEGDFRLLIRSRIDHIGIDTCIVRTLYRGDSEEVAADTVVFINAKEPMRAVFDDLRERGFGKDRMVIVGDARAPRDLHLAISEGHRLVRAMV